MSNSDDLVQEMQHLGDHVEPTQALVHRVCGHRVRLDQTLEFKLEFVDGDTQWIPDSKCDCEELISAYCHSNSLRTAYLFCRVSTKDQARGVSLQTQESALAHAVRLKYPDHHRFKIVTATCSAYKSIPRNLRRVADLTKKGDVLAAYNYDRLGRNLFEYLPFLQDLHARDVTVYSHETDSVYGEQSLTFMEGILNSHKESQILGNRIRRALHWRLTVRGDEHVGNVEYGKMYTKADDGRLVVRANDSEQKIIKRVLRESRRMTPETIAHRLNDEGVLKRKKKWNFVMVKNLCKKFNTN